MLAKPRLKALQKLDIVVASRLKAPLNVRPAPQRIDETLFAGSRPAAQLLFAFRALLDAVRDGVVRAIPLQNAIAPAQKRAAAAHTASRRRHPKIPQNVLIEKNALV